MPLHEVPSRIMTVKPFHRSEWDEYWGFTHYLHRYGRTESLQKNDVTIEVVRPVRLLPLHVLDETEVACGS